MNVKYSFKSVVIFALHAEQDYPPPKKSFLQAHTAFIIVFLERWLLAIHNKNCFFAHLLFKAVILNFTEHIMYDTGTVFSILMSNNSARLQAEIFQI